jgi:repressor LexA
MDRFNLTSKQKVIFDFIKSYFTQHGITPTQKEIGNAVGIAQATVAKHLSSLEKRGWIKRAQGMKNAMRILS